MHSSHAQVGRRAHKGSKDWGGSEDLHASRAGPLQVVSALDPTEYGLHVLAEGFLENPLPGAVLARPASLSLSSEAHVLLLRSITYVWDKHGLGFVDRLQLAEWLKRVANIPARKHRACLRNALFSNREASAELCARLQALDQGSGDSSATSDWLRPSDFPEQSGFEAWRRCESAALVAMLHALCKLPAFDGHLKITILRATARQRTAGSRGLVFRCVAGGASSSLVAPYCKVKVAHNSSVLCTARTKAGHVQDASRSSVDHAEWEGEALALNVASVDAQLQVELYSAVKHAGSSHGAQTPIGLPNPDELVGRAFISLGMLQKAGPFERTYECKLLGRRSVRRQFLDCLYLRAPGKQPSRVPVAEAALTAERHPSISFAGLASWSELQNTPDAGLESPREAPESYGRAQVARVLFRDDSNPGLAVRNAVPDHDLDGDASGRQVMGRVIFKVLYCVEERNVPKHVAAFVEARRKEELRLDQSRSPKIASGAPPALTPPSNAGAPASLAAAPTIAPKHAYKKPAPSQRKPSRVAFVVNRASAPQEDYIQAAYWEVLCFLWRLWRNDVGPPGFLNVAPRSQNATCRAPSGAPNLHEVRFPMGALGTLLPHQGTLDLAGAFGCLHRVRPATQLLLAAHLLLDDWSHNDVDYLCALDALLCPVAGAVHDALLTHSDLRLLVNANGRLLQHCVRVLERFHSAFSEDRREAGLRALCRLAALGVRMDPDVEAIAVSEAIRPHVVAAVKQRMVQHEELLRTDRLDKSLLVEALRTTLQDLQHEQKLSAALPSGVNLVARSGAVRYSLIAAALSRAWPRPPADCEDDLGARRGGSAHGESDPPLAWDGVLEELEGLLGGVHTLLIEAGAASAPESNQTRRLNADFEGAVRLMPGKGIQLVDVDALLAPALLDLVSRISVDIDGLVERLVSHERLATLPTHQWVAQANVRYSKSVVELFRQLDGNFDAVGRITICNRPVDLRHECALRMMQQAGITLRHYVSLIEDHCIKELRPAAAIAIQGGLLPPALAEIFASNAAAAALSTSAPAADIEQHLPPCGKPPQAEPPQVKVSAAGGIALAADLPPVMTRALSVKLSNLEEASHQQLQLQARLARQLRYAATGEWPPPGRAGRDSGGSGSECELMVDGDGSDEDSGDVDGTSLPGPIDRVASGIEQHVRRGRTTVVQAIAAVVGSRIVRAIADLLGRVDDKAPPPSKQPVPPRGPRKSASSRGTQRRTGSSGAARESGGMLLTLDTNAALDAFWKEHLKDVLQREDVEASLKVLSAELEVMAEHLSQHMMLTLFEALWEAVVGACETLLLNTCPLVGALSARKAQVLQHLWGLFRVYFHGVQGDGLELQQLDQISAVLTRLFALFHASTAKLEDVYKGLWETQAQEDRRGTKHNGQGVQAYRALTPSKLTLLNVVQLLSQRVKDAQAQKLVAEYLKHAKSHTLRVIFGLPASESSVLLRNGQPAISACCMGKARGHLYITDKHVGFSSISAQRNALFAAKNPALQNTTLLVPLARVTAMSKAFHDGSRALAFTTFEKGQHVFHDFESDGVRDEIEEAVRLHVMGSNTLLDRFLRGLVAATPAVALGLPNGQAIERSYPCANYMFGLGQNRRGVLYVCSSMLVFDCQDAAKRVVTKYKEITRVQLSKGAWAGSFSVIVSFEKPPFKLELCEMISAVAEEMVAEIMDCMSRTAAD